MAIRRIVKYPDPILLRKTKPVNYEAVKDGLADLLNDMSETCLSVSGAGLAANQIGLDMSLAVILITENKKVYRLVLINPKIVSRSGRMEEDEGCLSFPGLFGTTVRSAKVKVRALDEKGVQFEFEAEGFLAKALQHEIDHLEGKIFIDRLSPLEKTRAKNEIKTLKKKWAEADSSAKKNNENDIHGNAGNSGPVSKKTDADKQR